MFDATQPQMMQESGSAGNGDDSSGAIVSYSFHAKTHHCTTTQTYTRVCNFQILL